MFKLLLKLLLLPPDLLKAHARGYADLAGQASAQYLGTLRKRGVVYSLSVIGFLLAVFWGGMALLLWSASLPSVQMRHAWVLLALPLGCLVISGLCWAWARSMRPKPLINDIKAQIQLDMDMLQKAKVS